MNALLILGIDTSAKIASVALMEGETVLAEHTVSTTLTHSQIILPMVKALLSDADKSIEDLDGIAVAAGPGSYTGLRIGIAAVKGMCLGLDIKAAGVSTLEALAWNAVSLRSKIFSVMNARRDVAYFGQYASDGERITRLCEDRVCPVEEIKAAADDSDIILVGDYAAALKEKLFADCGNVRAAPGANRLQRAVCLCQSVMNSPERLDIPDRLDAIYLQPTKAEKNLKNK